MQNVKVIRKQYNLTKNDLVSTFQPIYLNKQNNHQSSLKKNGHFQICTKRNTK